MRSILTGWIAAKAFYDGFTTGIASESCTEAVFRTQIRMLRNFKQMKRASTFSVKYQQTVTLSMELTERLKSAIV